MHPSELRLSIQILNYNVLLTCKVISFPNEKTIYALLTFKRGPTGSKHWGPLAVFVTQQKNYSRKAVLQNAKLLSYNYGGDKMQPLNSRKCQLSYVRWMAPFLH